MKIMTALAFLSRRCSRRPNIRPGLLLILCIVLPGQAIPGGAEVPVVYEFRVQRPFDEAYQALYQALEEARFYVIFEANIGHNLARNAERWGQDYNRNRFEHMKSLVICNHWYANQALNLDPRFMSMCPLTVGVVHREGVTTVYFKSLTNLPGSEAAADLLWEVENTIVSAIETVASLVN